MLGGLSNIMGMKRIRFITVIKITKNLTEWLYIRNQKYQDYRNHCNELS